MSGGLTHTHHPPAPAITCHMCKGQFSKEKMASDHVSICKGCTYKVGIIILIIMISISYVAWFGVI